MTLDVQPLLAGPRGSGLLMRMNEEPTARCGFETAPLHSRTSSNGAVMTWWAGAHELKVGTNNEN